MLLSWFAPTASVTPMAPLVSAVKTIQTFDAKFAYEFFWADSGKIHLIPNYSTHLESARVIADNKCTGAINGGFYAQDNQPLGLVLADSTEISRVRQSQLFNGFFSIDNHGQSLIAVTYPEDAKIIMQSGPTLITAGKVVDLVLNDDKLARRMVVATTNDNSVLFLTVYHPQTELAGPLLDELPSIIKSIADQENISINSALNLDGGRASSFYSNNLTLTELTPVGSLFCVK